MGKQTPLHFVNFSIKSLRKWKEQLSEEFEEYVDEADEIYVKEAFVPDMDIFPGHTRPCGEVAMLWTLLAETLATLKSAMSANSIDTVRQACLDWLWLFSDYEDEALISYKALCKHLDLELYEYRDRVVESIYFPESFEQLEFKYLYMLHHPDEFTGRGPRVKPNEVDF